MDELKILKKRRSLLNKIIKDEQKQVERLKYKSRSVRMSYNADRMNWFTDRFQELDLVIDLIEKTVTPKQFTHWLIDDEVGNACTIVGNIAKIKN